MGKTSRFATKGRPHNLESLRTSAPTESGAGQLLVRFLTSPANVSSPGAVHQTNLFEVLRR